MRWLAAAFALLCHGFGFFHLLGMASARTSCSWASHLDDPEADLPEDFADQSVVADEQWDFPPDLGEPLAASAVDGTPLLHFDVDVGFVGAKTFSGAKHGWVFKVGPIGLGYYLDQPDLVFRGWVADQAQLPADILLTYLEVVHKGDAMLPSARVHIPIDTFVPCDVSQTFRYGRRPRVGGNSRYQRRRAAKADGRPSKGSGVTADWLTTVQTIGVSRLDNRHRSNGIWACDSYNGNAMSTIQSYMESSAADVVLSQEPKVLARCSHRRWWGEQWCWYCLPLPYGHGHVH